MAHGGPKRLKMAFMLFSLVASIATGWAQSALEGVHLQPPVARAALQTSTNSAADQARPGVIRSGVDLVMVPVTVIDQTGRVVLGLQQSNFQLFDGKHVQEIRNFSSEDEPASVGIVLDLSHSMMRKTDWARRAVSEFCRIANPADEFFMVSFSDRPQLMADFTPRVEDIVNKLAFTATRGRTAMLDAVYLALNHMRQARYRRRALLIISDGGDNHSRYTESEIRSMVKEADVSIYGIGIFDQASRVPEEMYGPILLEEIAQLTGGRSFTIERADLLPAIAEKVGTELRNQYVLTYRPQDSARDGKWHKLKIKLTIPKSLWPVWIHSKPGYYAPRD